MIIRSYFSMPNTVQIFKFLFFSPLESLYYIIHNQLQLTFVLQMCFDVNFSQKFYCIKERRHTSSVLQGEIQFFYPVIIHITHICNRVWNVSQLNTKTLKTLKLLALMNSVCLYKEKMSNINSMRLFSADRSKTMNVLYSVLRGYFTDYQWWRKY